MPGFKRLPNRYGTITRLSGKRRKPFCARKYVGEVWDDENHTYRVKYASVGTYETRKEALDALAKANLDERFAAENISFGSVADTWLNGKKDEVSAGMWKNYMYSIRVFDPIRDRRLGDLKTIDFERLLNADGVPPSNRKRAKIALNGIYDYALRHEYIVKDYSALVHVHNDNEVKIKRIVFTPDEVRTLELKDRTDDEDAVLTMLYTGLRVSEAYGIKRENVDLDRKLLIGVGSKTDAGKNRTIPIHEAILPVIQKHAGICGKNGSLFLFNHSPNKMPPYTMQLRFKTAFPNHTSHDCRHSFATYAYKSRMDVAMVKMIMGHKVGDITQGRYTHITVEDLTEEMKKYEIS